MSSNKSKYITAQSFLFFDDFNNINFDKEYLVVVSILL